MLKSGEAQITYYLNDLAPANKLWEHSFMPVFFRLRQVVD